MKQARSSEEQIIESLKAADAAESRTRRRIRRLFLTVVVIFFAQFIGGKVWNEPVPGLFAPEFAGDAIEFTNEKTNRPRPPNSRLRARFQDGVEEFVPLAELAGGIYYKQQKRFERAFLKRLKKDRPETTSQLVAWLTERYFDATPERTLVRLSWTDVNENGSEVTTAIRIHAPESD